jgi:IS605 OrfB family transposase
LARKHIFVQLKLPKNTRPVTRRDWSWTKCKLTIPPKIHQWIHSDNPKFHLPTLRYVTLKSGLTLPFLDFVWTIEKKQTYQLQPKRVMATDLGVINLTTSVICEAGSQISSPIFWSPQKTLLHKIEQLYYHITWLQRKLDRYPENWGGKGKRIQERDRLYRKLKRYREEILHLTSNKLLETALRRQCQTLVLEDLRNYKPPKHKRKLTRKLSNWLRGSLYELLVYKARYSGINVKRVNPHWTSSYYPRCGVKGQKISDPLLCKTKNTGRFFYCVNCQYYADRDYIASLNIYRLSQEQRKKRFSLKTTQPS